MKAIIFNRQIVRGSQVIEEGCIALALNESEYQELKDKLQKLGFKEIKRGREAASIPTPQRPPASQKVKLSSNSPLFLMRE